MQATVSRRVEFKGLGVHQGQNVTATVLPAPINHGIRFRRIDITDRPNEIDARFDRVVDTRLCTVLASDSGVTVATVEHLMAALAGVGVSNALIEIDGPETPIMDGSSEPFVRGLMDAGVTLQEAPQRAIRVLKPVEVESEGRWAALSPSERFEMHFEIDFEDKAIGRQVREMRLVNGAFIEDLCRARTFGRLADVEKLRSMGLARGGSMDNAIVVDRDRVLNPEGLRYADEFVRHKMLDAVGDLALAGAPVIARYEGRYAGHEMTNLLLRALFKDPSSFEWVEYDRARPLALGLCSAPIAA